MCIRDRSPIGRTPRSNPATYIGAFTPIRELFSNTELSKERGYAPGQFSFNVAVGRCFACEGDGVKKIEMQFLSDVYVKCDECNGKRYNSETLGVMYKGKNIADILEMTVEEALDFFENIPTIKRKLETVMDVGLGYIKLGQSSTTLSGGEAQRVKLASELSKRGTGKTLYILDEPTTGLDPQARLKLSGLLEKIGSRGGTTLLTTHSMEEASRLCDRIAIMDHGKVIAINTPVALIESLGTKQIIEFKVEGQIEEEIINKFPGVQWNFDQNGIGLLTVSSAGEAIKRVLFELGKCNANIIGVTSHQGTLEDVFVKLTGRSLRDV